MERPDENDFWARYRAMLPSVEEQEAARERMEASLQRAADEGFFEELRALRGKVRFTVPLEELREDDD